MVDLNDFSVLIRYPSHIALEEADATEALQAVGIIRAEILRLL